jgi:nucleotide-binding universal stress UspA family protein
MFEHLLVGIDGQQGGRDALALARVLLPARGRLTLATAYAPKAYVWRGGSPAYQARDRDDARAVLEAAREGAEIEGELWCIESPSVGAGLHHLAQEMDADILVVGSSSRGLVGRVMLGDDTRAALNGAACAVAVAPAGYAEQRHAFERVGVGYNGSVESEHALGVARELARQFGARLAAFEAVSIPARVVMGGAAPVGISITELVGEAQDHLSSFGGIEAHAAYGAPAEELSLFSASVDLLIVGSRRYGPVGRVVHGSTASQLTRSARCPLLVLTRGARASDATVVHLAADRREAALADTAT